MKRLAGLVLCVLVLPGCPEPGPPAPGPGLRATPAAAPPPDDPPPPEPEEKQGAAAPDPDPATDPDPAPPQQPEPAPEKGKKPWAGFVFAPSEEGAAAKIVVTNVAPGSPAARAGLRTDDLVTAVDGQEGAGPEVLVETLRSRTSGETIALTVSREGKPHEVTLTLDAYDLSRLVDAAIAVGAERLASRQIKDGTWMRLHTDESMGGDIPLTSLIVRSLFNLPKELAPKYRAVAEKGLAALLAKQAENGAIVGHPTFQHYRTYTSSLTMLILQEQGRADSEAAKGLYGWFLKTQLDDDDNISEYDFARHGGWNKYDENRSATMDSDISVTSFAVEALVRAGMKTDSDAFKKTMIFVRRTQNLPKKNAPADPRLDGGFGNSPRTSKAGAQQGADGSVVYRSFGSPTADGLRTMLRLGLPKDHRRVQAALTWLADHFELRVNPNFPDSMRPISEGIIYYYVNSLSDALSLYGEKTLKASDGTEIEWATRIARRMVALQKADGTWHTESALMHENDPTLTTAFVVAILTRCRQFF